MTTALPLALAFALTVCLAARAKAQAPLVSPEVHPDRTVTFRFKDPGASKVEVDLEGQPALTMTKSADGVWTATSPPLQPDLYGYTFSADGEARIDPLNWLTKPNLLWIGNMVLVPGDPPELWEVQNVPHGQLDRHFYRSGIVGDERDYYVYTPPGYRESSRKRYPVLYLLHGFSDMANGWTAVGQAQTILDNLIAQGKAKPMLVVMPLGYGVSDFASRRSRSFDDADLNRRNFENYRKALLDEVVPQVEKEYRVLGDPAHRAIAGLSMGGAESLFVGLNNMDKFDYVGAFSSGGLPGRSPDLAFPGFSGATANARLRALWIACGTADGLIEFNRTLVQWLQGKGTKLTFLEVPGRHHEWPLWRRNLATFASMIF